MASNLTIVTTTAAGMSGSRSFGAQAGAEIGGDDPLGIFAALLAPTPEAPPAAPGPTEAGIGTIVDLAFGFGQDGTAEEMEDPEAIAAVIDAAAPAAPVDARAAFTDLVGRLADLKADLDAGRTPELDELAAIDATLGDLATALGVDLADIPALGELDDLMARMTAGDAGVTAQLTAALAPLARTLLGSVEASEGSAATEFTTLLKSIGDTLTALLDALGSGDVAPERLAALGLDAEVDTDLQAALTRLSVAIAEEPPAPPPLAAPELKLTEPVLTGKPAETQASPPPPDPAKPAADGDGKPSLAAPVQQDAPDRDPGDRATDRQPEPRPVPATAAAAPAEPPPETLPAGQTAHQASRIDAAAVPRIVQAGYQTSQQQLNLPQLAFELVRQVNDGNTRFQIRLDPPELGKIDVRLDIDKAGQVTARLTVEKAETLDLMQRDQRGLERALQQAGLDGSKTNLEFSLKQNPFAGGQQGQQDRGGDNRFLARGGSEDAEQPAPTVNLYRASLTAGGVNIIA